MSDARFCCDSLFLLKFLLHFLFFNNFVEILYSFIFLESESVFFAEGLFFKTQPSLVCLSQAHTHLKTHSTAAASRVGEWLEREGRAKRLRQPEARHSPH